MEARQVVDARAASPPVNQDCNHGGSAAAFPYKEVCIRFVVVTSQVISSVQLHPLKLHNATQVCVAGVRSCNDIMMHG